MKKKGKKIRHPLLDFLIEELQKDEIIHWDKTSEPGTFIMKQHAHKEIAQRWGIKRKKGKRTYSYFARVLRLQYPKKLITHITQPDPCEPENSRSPVYKIHINNEKVKPYINKHKVSFD